MTKPDGTIRPIQYPLNRSDDLESTTPNTPPIENLSLDGWVTNDPDERVPVVLDVSLNEYVALATCVDVGRDIAYGDNSIYLWWVWVRSLLGMDLCDLILQCMLTNDDIQEAIANYSGGSNINSTTPENPANLSSELVDNPPLCDDDIIYGMTTQLVEFADRLLKDVFEQIDASQLSSTNVGYLIKLIPFVETLPLDEAFELTDKLVDDMETAYLAASTQLLKTEIACDLYCLAKNNGCVLTLEMVRDYYQDKSGVVFSYTSVFDFITDFLSGTFIGNAVFYGMNVLFFQIFAFGGKFLEYVFEDYLKVIQSMYNDPDPDWLTDCDPCVATWSHTFDFTLNDGGFVPYAPAGFSTYGVWVNGIGWSFEDKAWDSPTTQWRRAIAIRKLFTDVNVTELSFTWDLVKGNFSAVSTIESSQFRDNSIQGSNQNANNTDRATGTHIETFTCDENADELRLFCCSSAVFQELYTGSCVITSCTVKGTGSDPF